MNAIFSPIPFGEKLSGFAPMSYELRYRNENCLYEGKHEPIHVHSCFEIYFHISGNVSFLGNGVIYPLSFGDVIFTRPNETHVCIYNKAETVEYFCLWIHCPLDAEIFDFSKQNKDIYISASNEDKYKLKDLLFKLHKDISPLDKTADILSILQIIAKGNQNKAIVKKNDGFSKIIKFIDDNFLEIQTIDDIAKRFDVSPSTISRWFRSKLNISPASYITARKMAYSKMLLIKGESITDTCFKSGFNDCAYYVALFKKTFGITPLQFKKSSEKK